MHIEIIILHTINDAFLYDYMKKKFKKKKNLFKERNRMMNIRAGKIDAVQISNLCNRRRSFI